MQGNTLSRKEREKAGRRREILEVAEQVFAEKGFHGATIEEIARRTEFAVGTLYKFFSGKEEMYAAILLERAREMETAVSKISADAALDPLEAIGCFIERKAAFCAEHAAFVRLLLKEQAGGSPIVAETLREQVRPLFHQAIKQIEVIIQRGIKTGQLRNLPSRDIALALEGITHAFLLGTMDDGGRYDYESKVHLMKTLFLSGART